MVDQCILSWLYNTISKDVHTIIHAPKAMAYTIWNAIHDQFRDHELHRAVYLEAEFRSLFQGDMNIKTYTGRLKRLADALRDVGQPVREMSQVLNMLCGLPPKYRHAVPVITAKNPPHTFLSARSYLLLEEQYDKEHTKSSAQHALLATGGTRPPASAAGEGGSGTGQGAQPPPRPPIVAHSSAPRSDGRHGRGHGRGRGGYQHQGGSNSTPQPRAPQGWAPRVNLWTGMVQAWPMPFRVPSTGVLGPHPGQPQQQAYFAGPPSIPAPGVPQPQPPPQDV
ncbi:uncharacterized protein [Miscanthus floridulus]|uniref:uncharacterized protein n=1 Tax=Miscanthus floridulus TaxID=154761 RepID=UPI00345ADEA7